MQYGRGKAVEGEEYIEQSVANDCPTGCWLEKNVQGAHVSRRKLITWVESLERGPLYEKYRRALEEGEQHYSLMKSVECIHKSRATGLPGVYDRLEAGLNAALRLTWGFKEGWRAHDCRTAYRPCKDWIFQAGQDYEVKETRGFKALLRVMSEPTTTVEERR